MTADEARAATGLLNQTFDIAVTQFDQLSYTCRTVKDQLVDLIEHQVWVGLGYASWDAYADTELVKIRLAVEQRQELVVALRLEGLSMRAIASGLGIDRKTVREDITQVVPNGPPDAELPATVVGLDGKRYPARKAAQPAPARRRTRPHRLVADRVVEGTVAAVEAIAFTNRSVLEVLRYEELDRTRVQEWRERLQAARRDADRSFDILQMRLDCWSTTSPSTTPA